MESHKRLQLANLAWAEERLKIRPDFFAMQAKTQAPEFMWIGCSDSRVPAEEITGCGPGELFVHRNIANLAGGKDLSIQSALEYAIDVLRVKHVIVCGHYNCGGVKSAMTGSDLGLVNSWLQQITDIYRVHHDEIESITSDQDRWDRMVEINAAHQLENLARTPVVRRAWRRAEWPTLHAWVYDLRSGLLSELALRRPSGDGQSMCGNLSLNAGMMIVD